jgi:hypothetical protein
MIISQSTHPTGITHNEEGVRIMLTKSGWLVEKQVIVEHW